MKFTIECEMNERWVDHFLSFLNNMEINGNMGHSELLGFYADGDGDFRPKFKADIPYELKDGYYSRPETVYFYDAG